MNEELFKIVAITLNIFQKNEHDAIIKVMSNKDIFFLYAKGFFKLESKNRSNVFVGSISEFEIFKNYGKDNYFLLKKSNIKNFFDFSSEENTSINEKLFYLFQKIEKYNEKFFVCYTNFLLDNEQYKKYFFLTYITNIVLETHGKKLIFNKCVICGTNQDLYCVDVYEGGMLCFLHKSNKGTSELQIVKAFYNLDNSFKDYYKNSNEKLNNIIFQILFNFLKE